MLVRRGMLFLLFVCLLAACLPTPEPTPTPDRTFQTQNPELVRPFLITLEDMGWQGGEMTEVPVFDFWDGEVDYISVNLTSTPESKHFEPGMDLYQEVFVYPDESTASDMFDRIRNQFGYVETHLVEIDPKIQKSLVQCSDLEIIDLNRIWTETKCGALLQYKYYFVRLGSSAIDGSPSYDDWDLFVEKAQERLISNAERGN